MFITNDTPPEIRAEAESLWRLPGVVRWVRGRLAEWHHHQLHLHQLWHAVYAEYNLPFREERIILPLTGEQFMIPIDQQSGAEQARDELKKLLDI